MVTRGRAPQETGDREYWGAPEGWGGSSEEKEFGLYEDNCGIIRFFLSIQTQWSVTMHGERVGLVYPGVEAAARMSEFELTAEAFSQLQLMEKIVIKESRKNGR